MCFSALAPSRPLILSVIHRIHTRGERLKAATTNVSLTREGTPLSVDTHFALCVLETNH